MNKYYNVVNEVLVLYYNILLSVYALFNTRNT